MTELILMRLPIKFPIIAVSVLLLSSCITNSGVSSLVSTEDVSFEFTGPEEIVIENGQWGLSWLPDAPISFLSMQNSVSVFFAAGRSTYFLSGDNFESLTPHQIDSENRAVPVLVPNGTDFDRDYAGSSSVLTASNGIDLLMFYHAEDQSCGIAYPRVSIGLARSSDNGVTWVRQGKIIESSEPAAPCSEPRFNGAGSFSLAISPDGNYLYLYFMEWLRGQEDGIRLARSTISGDGTPDSWFKYKDGSFEEIGLGGQSDFVIRRSSVKAGFAGVPAVSFNSYLNQYIAIIIGHDGFYAAFSPDGINWETPHHIWEVPALTSQANLKDGDSWYYYPSFISPDLPNQMLTGQTGYLYYAHGYKNGPPHFMARRPLRLDLFRVMLPTVYNSSE